jgi:hypothetical protein
LRFSGRMATYDLGLSGFSPHPSLLRRLEGSL